MKHKFWLILCAVICSICMLFAFAACSEKTPDEGNNPPVVDGGTMPDDGAIDDLFYVERTNPVTGKMEYVVSGVKAKTSSYISIPSTYNDCPVVEIMQGAFKECEYLISVEIPDSITSIGKLAFESCSSLTHIAIPYSVTSIEEGVFGRCSSLTNIYIPESVTSIGNLAFCECSSLTNITFPESVTSIGDFAFCECSSLTSMTVPDRVTSIGYGAFRECSSLTSVTIGKGVTSIEAYAFFDCSSLTSITIPDGVTSIWERAFMKCSSLTSAIFENANGWAVEQRAISELDDPAVAAKYLTDTYCSDKWKRT